MPSAATAKYIFLLIFLAVIFITAIVPINSNDFFWHLKSGEYLLKYKEFPLLDPFTYTAMPDDPDFPGRPQFIMKQYWLAQILYAVLVKYFGLEGVIYFRGFLYLIIASLVIYMLNKKTSSSLIFIPLILFALSTRIALEDSDRPQLFAFLFSFLVVVIIEAAVNEREKWLFYLNIPLMLIASNMHAGYVVGIVYMIIYMFSAFFEERLKPYRKAIVISGIISISITYLNPAHWQVIHETIRVYNPTRVTQTIMEYKSPFTIFPYVTANIGWLSYWALVIISLPAMIHQFKKRRFTWGLLMLLTIGASLSSMRYIYFFIPISTIVTSFFLNDLFSGRFSMKAPLQIAAALLLLLVIYLKPFHSNQVHIKNILWEMSQPVSASDFLSKEDLPQPVFNDIHYGGYLEWKLWPKYKMFIDTRELINNVYLTYLDVMNYSQQGKDFLKFYGIATVVTPAISPYTGEIIPLVRGLYQDHDWSLVYADGQCLIFVRKGLYSREISRNRVYEEVLREIQYWRPFFPWIKEYENSRDEAFRILSQN